MKSSLRQIANNKLNFERLTETMISLFPEKKQRFLLSSPTHIESFSETEQISKFLLEYPEFILTLDDDIINHYYKFGIPIEFHNRHISIEQITNSLQQLGLKEGITLLPFNILISLHRYQAFNQIYELVKLVVGTYTYGKREKAFPPNVVLYNYFRKIKNQQKKIIEKTDSKSGLLDKTFVRMIKIGFDYKQIKRLFLNASKRNLEREIIFASIQHDFYFDPKIYKKGIDYGILFNLLYPSLCKKFKIYGTEESFNMSKQYANYQNYDDYKKRILKKIIEKK